METLLFISLILNWIVFGILVGKWLIWLEYKLDGWNVDKGGSYCFAIFFLPLVLLFCILMTFVRGVTK